MKAHIEADHLVLTEVPPDIASEPTLRFPLSNVPQSMQGVTTEPMEVDEAKYREMLVESIMTAMLGTEPLDAPGPSMTELYALDEARTRRAFREMFSGRPNPNC